MPRNIIIPGDIIRVLEIRFRTMGLAWQKDRDRGVPKMPRKLKKACRLYHDDVINFDGRRRPAREMHRLWLRSWDDERESYRDLGGFAGSVPGCVKQIADAADARCLAFMREAALNYNSGTPVGDLARSFEAVFAGTMPPVMPPVMQLMVSQTLSSGDCP